MKALKRVLLTLVCFILLCGSNPARADESRLTMNADGSFKILIIADIQDSLYLNSYTARLMEAALDSEQPDLVVLLGDNIYGMAPMLIFSESNTQQAIRNITKPITDRDIAFAVVMGNHDSEGSLAREAQMEIYESLPGCLAVAGETQTGVGNYNLQVYDSENQSPVLNLWFVDSGVKASAEEGGGYAYVADDQIAWYERGGAALRESNGGEPLPAMLFQHIPVPEIYDLLAEAPTGTEGAVKGHGIHSDRTWVLNPALVSDGTLEEGPCPPDINNGQFESWVSQGDIFAAFFGHDHVNDFVGTVQGIDLVHTAGVGFYSYGKGGQHGARVIEIQQDDPRAYTTRMVYYEDLVGGSIPFPLRHWGFLISEGIAAGLVVILLIAALCTILIRRRRRRTRKAQH